MTGAALPALVAAALAALAAVVLLGPPGDGARRRAAALGAAAAGGRAGPGGRAGSAVGRGARDGARDGAGVPRRLPVRLAATLAGLGVAVLVGGLPGAGAGLAVAALAPRALARFEPRDVRERRERLAAQAADVADLLAACLASGAPVPTAVEAVAAAIGPPAAEPLRGWVAGVALGADQAQAWRALATEPALAPLALAAARSADSGAPLADLLPGVAADLRRRSRARAESAARAAGVAAVAPLAACFLPAFLLLGVVPVVAALASQLLAG